MAQNQNYQLVQDQLMVSNQRLLVVENEIVNIQAMQQHNQQQLQDMQQQTQQQIQAFRQEMLEQNQAIQQQNQVIRQEMQQQSQAIRQEMQQQSQAIRQEMQQQSQAIRQEMQQQNQLQNQVNQQHMQHMLQSQQELLATFANNQGLTINQKNSVFKLLNKSANFEGQLHFLLNDQGQQSPEFPQSKIELFDLSVHRLNANLQFYGLPLNGNKTRRIMEFSRFIGAE